MIAGLCAFIVIGQLAGYWAGRRVLLRRGRRDAARSALEPLPAHPVTDQPWPTLAGAQEPPRPRLRLDWRRQPEPVSPPRVVPLVVSLADRVRDYYAAADKQLADQLPAWAAYIGKVVTTESGLLTIEYR